MNLDAHQYLGLLFLTLGCAGFVILLLTLRLLAGRSGGRRALDEQGRGSWLSREPLSVIATYDETPDIKWFKLRRESGLAFPNFKAGQFLTFQIGDDPKAQRSYSILSSAANRWTVEVGIKRLPSGKGSNWFHERKAGDRVLAMAPSGQFTDLDLDPKVKRIYLAGGIGITPLLSMIHSNIDSGTLCPMHLIYGARTEKDLAFHVRIKELARRFPRLEYTPVISHDENYAGDRGFINEGYLRRKELIDESAHFFICGPSVMSDKLVNDLLASGVDETRIHLEAFSSPIDFEKLEIPERTAKITVNGRQLAYSGKKTLLEFLENQNVEIASACRSGVCGACKCEPSGKVQSLANDGLTLSERRKGMALACVSFPLEDLEIKIAK